MAKEDELIVGQSVSASISKKKEVATKRTRINLRRLQRGLLRRASRVPFLVKDFLGLKTPLHTHSRYVLERIIIPYFVSRMDMKTALFVGCDWYTKHYQKLFRGMEYWTIDPDPKKKRYGFRNHVVDLLENLYYYFPSGYFDLIICIGVYGWGLNQKEQCELALRNCFDCLREGGEFVLGWDDLPEDSPSSPISRHYHVSFEELRSLGWHRPVPLEELESLKAFRRQRFAPLATWRYPTTWQYLGKGPFCHIYDFYVKRNAKSHGCQYPPQCQVPRSVSDTT